MVHTRQPQLDAIRAFAVLLVLWQHTMAPRALLTRDAGAIGVVVFFVLSGYLITGILLDARSDAEAVGASRGGVLRRFYVRRFLRIFPLYYGVLFVTWYLGDPNVRQYIWWLVVYGTNFLMASLSRNIGLPTPFWSLAVEEQFYLFWPCVVLFVPRRRLPWIAFGMVGLSVAARFLLAVTGSHGNRVTMPTWSALDGLAIGALLALAHRSARDFSRELRWVLAAGVALMIARLGLIGLGRARPIHFGLWMLPWAMIGVWLVDQAARDRLPAMFRWRSLTWVGVVSYGIYVYHHPLMYALGIAHQRGVLIFADVTAVTIAVASVSWLVYERPINHLKRFWPYVRRPALLIAVPPPIADSPDSLPAHESAVP